MQNFKQEKGVGDRAFKKLQEQEGGGTVPLEAAVEPQPRQRPGIPDPLSEIEYHKGIHGDELVDRAVDQNGNHWAKRKQALTADPDNKIWTQSPSTVHVEFKNRMGGGTHPDDVVRSILAEINDHYTTGQITNRDAHRAANEAIGRYFMVAKKGVRKQAWTGWGPDQSPKRHKVGGWEWDNHLNGYLSTAHRQFECSCGEPVKVPDYHNCKCGRIWNTYVIGTGGDRKEATAEKFIAREIPNREAGGEKIVVANSTRPPTPMRDPKWNRPRNKTLNDTKSRWVPELEQGDTPEEDSKDDFDVVAKKLRNSHYEDYDKWSNDVDRQIADEVENNNPFPSKHQPRKKKDNRAKGVTDGKSSPDWYKRDHSSQQFVGRG